MVTFHGLVSPPVCFFTIDEPRAKLTTLSGMKSSLRKPPCTTTTKCRPCCRTCTTSTGILSFPVSATVSAE
jgi:hypothetical protein